MLNAAFAIKSESKQRYAALQADVYQPKKLDSKVNLCMSEESINLLSDATRAALNMEAVVGQFGTTDNTPMYVPCADVRYIVMGMPKLFVYDKDAKDYFPLVAGTKLAGTKKVTAAKLFVCAIVGGVILTDDNGDPEIFTLNLKSSRTSVLKAKSPVPGDGTLYSLNVALNNAYKVKGWLTHLVAINLHAVPCRFTSSTSADTSMGTKYTLGTDATPLSDADQELMFNFVQQPEIKAVMADPYQIHSRQALSQVQSRAVAFDVTDENVFF